jgi:pimeloyl-ACP methyl ester carboxylesterase
MRGVAGGDRYDDVEIVCISPVGLLDRDDRQAGYFSPRGRAEGDPVVLLLHGFPTSSHMFRNLIPALADEVRPIAPDYPGYGNNSMPTVDEFAYTFDHLVEVTVQRGDRLREPHGQKILGAIFVASHNNHARASIHGALASPSPDGRLYEP